MSHFIKIVFILITAAQLSCFAQTSYYKLREDAESYLSAGKLGEAIDLLNKYISADPERADGYYLRGQAFEKRGNYEEAVRDYRSASKLEPANRSYSTDLNRAREEWNKLLVNRIEGYKREIVVNPAIAKNYLEIGKSYKNLEDWESAEIWYDEYLKREEASPDEILRYTEILARNKKYSKGLPILKRYTTMFPGDHRLWSRYGYFNLWLGNRSRAIEAFEESLKIRPFFKEAMEGLDQAKGKGYNYTYTGTTRGGPVYLIDKYFRELKTSPQNGATRLLLIKELMKHKRLEEAYQQLEILKKDPAFTGEIDSLWNAAVEQRRKVHFNKIDELRAEYNKGKGTKDLLLQLARRYSYVEGYDSSAFFYLEYLRLNPGDLAARFEYAKVLAWNLDYEGSKKEVSLLLELDPGNPDYRLLYATLSVWMMKDLETAEVYLKDILDRDPNFDALIASVSLYIQKKDFTAAEDFLQRARHIDPANERVVKLESDLDFHKLRAEEEKIFQILEAGRVLAMQNKCKEALKLYEEYLPQADPSRMVQKEYADVLACAGDFEKALKIYNDMLAEEYDFETDLQRAKVYYWSGDSLKALREFERLYASNPDNFDVKMYLGDVYTRMKMYPQAEKLFDAMLASGLDSTQRELIVLRKSWLPVGGIPGTFPGYVMITPSALYYEDNLEFTYNQQTLRADLNLSPAVTIAVDASLGFISSESQRESFTAYKGYVLFRPAENLLLGGAGGVTLFKGFEETPFFDGFIKYEKAEIYSASFNYTHTDAAFVLYSPELVNNRLSSDLFRLAGFYKFSSGIKLSGFVNRVYVSDINRGLFLELEAGMYFIKRLYAGYEYYHTSFQEVSPYYFSPDQYNQHSLTAEYDIIKEKVNRLTVGGKIGVIANSNFIPKEIYAGGMYSIISNLTAQARISYGTSLQNDIGYSSFSAQLAFYWFL